jgi:hypothetical protein
MHPTKLLLASVAAVFLAACGGGSGAGSLDHTMTAQAANKTPPGKAVTVSLPPATDAVVGVPIQLVAQVTDKAGKPVSGVALTWQSADPTIATVSAAGLLSPLRAGTVNVWASGGGSTAVTVVTVRAAPGEVVRSKYVGMNLSGLGYWASQFAFADLMKGATPWESHEDNGVNGAPFPSLTSDGYPASLRPGQHAISTLASDGSRYPAGRYVVLWDGDGTLSFPAGNATVVESAGRRIVLDVKASSGGLWIQIDATSAANPLRNIRFLWPGTEQTYASEPFTQEFLARVRPFSMLRFMDWGATNGSPVVAWSDRALVSDPTYATAKGVPLEVMIDLANKLHADPWFCIPHRATDDYVRNFATLLRTRLDPTLKPHIEYSNEMWNTSFAQTSWGLAESDRLGLPHPSGMPSAFYAQRSVQIFKIVQGVYGADSGRLVRVVAGQAVWTQFMEEVLAFGDTARNADVLAIAPYFVADAASRVENVNATLRLTSDQIVDQMLADIRGPVASAITANAALATRYGLKYKAYEGGTGNTTAYFPADKVDAMTQLFIAANRNPRMRDVYLEYYALWVAKGGETLNQYTDIGQWKPWGMWGALETVTQDPMTSPKYRGLLDFAAAHPTPP